MPDNKVPTVQPSAIIEPNPINIPPTNDLTLSLILGICILKSPEKIARAKEPSTKPKINKPLLDQNVSFTIVKHPLQVSKPSRRAGKILK